MYSYTMEQWLFLFYLYCFLGWCVESAWVSIHEKPPHFINRGFIRGPFLPLYGSGAIMMLVVSAPFQKNLFLTYIAGCIGATALEYVTGVTMEALFKVRYWDYSNERFNVKGYICLWASLSWGGLTILMTRVLHRPIERLMYCIPAGWLSAITFILTIMIAADFALSFRAAMDLRDILVGMEKAKEELAHLQKRLDVLMAVAEEERERRRSTAEMRVGELADALAERIRSIHEQMRMHPDDYLEAAKREALEIRDRFLNVRYKASEWRMIRDRWKRGLILGNPTMRGSAKVRLSLEEIKEAVKERLRQR